MIWLCLPVLDCHDYTNGVIKSLLDTIEDCNDLHVVIYDNASAKPYTLKQFKGLPFNITIIKSDRNKGFYYPLRELAEVLPIKPEDIVALAHNDLTYHEPNWNRALNQAFREDPLLALVGFNGVWMIDSDGHRGIGSMINMHNEAKILPGHCAMLVDTRQPDGSHIVMPVATIDSMFMAFRPSAIPLLKIDKSITLSHAYDCIWPLTLIDKGLHVGYMGVSINHYSAGFRTERHEKIGLRIEKDCERWCRENKVSRQGPENWRQAHVREAYNRFLPYKKTGQIPSWIDPEWNYHRNEEGPKFGYWKEWNE